MSVSYSYIGINEQELKVENRPRPQSVRNAAGKLWRTLLLPAAVTLGWRSLKSEHGTFENVRNGRR